MTSISESVAVEVAFSKVWRFSDDLDLRALAERNEFRTEGNYGVLSLTGATQDLALVPALLKPSNVAEQAVVKSLRAAGFRTERHRFPIEMTITGVPRSFQVSVRLLAPWMVAVTVRFHDRCHATKELVANLVRLQRLGTSPEVTSVFTSVAEVLSSHLPATDDAPKFGALPGGPRPLVHLRPDIESRDVAAWSAERERELVSALIRDEAYETSDPVLWREVSAKSYQLNRKGDARRWVNKQGTLLVNALAPKTIMMHEFRRMVFMHEMALALRAILADFRTDQTDFDARAEFFLSRLSAWVREPGAILRQSVGSRLAWDILQHELFLDADVELLGTNSDSAATFQHASAKYTSSAVVWWMHDELGRFLASTPPVPVGRRSDQQVIQIINATEAQVVAGDVNNYTTFVQLLNDAEAEVDQLSDVDEAAKDEARSILRAMRGTTGAIASNVAGGAGGAIVGTVLKQMLGLPT